MGGPLDFKYIDRRKKKIILKIEKRKRLSISIFHKSRGEREIFLQNLENQEEKENFNIRS